MHLAGSGVGRAPASLVIGGSPDCRMYHDIRNAVLDRMGYSQRITVVGSRAPNRGPPPGPHLILVLILPLLSLHLRF